MTKSNQEMLALNPFVGIWNTEGKSKSTEDADTISMVATDVYEWMPGKRFLLHRVDARMGTERMRSIEIIGYDDEKDELFSNSYDDKGAVSQFKCGLEGHDWVISGNGLRFHGAFDHDWQELSGTWELEENGVWTPWMDIKLTKAY